MRRDVTDSLLSLERKIANVKAANINNYAFSDHNTRGDGDYIHPPIGHYIFNIRLYVT